MAAIDTWYDYRTVWSGHPWLMLYAAVVALVFALAVVGTILTFAGTSGAGPLTILFIPSLLAAYLHHIMAMRRLPH